VEICKKLSTECGVFFIIWRFPFPDALTPMKEIAWKKLVKMMNYLRATKDDVPCMSDNDTGTIKWHVDAALSTRT
jgi:hypothetical protein